jgi:amidase
VSVLASRDAGPGGARLAEDARPGFASRDCYETYVHLLRAATSARHSQAEFAANTAAAAALSPEDRSYRALLRRGNTLSHREWLGFQQRRQDLIAAWRAFFDRYDVLLCPVASTAAFPMFGDVPKYARSVVVDGEDRPSANDYFWLGLASAAYLPSTTAPIARSSAGLPIGLQIIGPAGGDRTCIGLAGVLEQSHYAFRPPPRPPAFRARISQA